MITYDKHTVMDFDDETEVDGGCKETNVDEAGFWENGGKNSLPMSDDLDKHGYDGC